MGSRKRLRGLPGFLFTPCHVPVIRGLKIRHKLGISALKYWGK